MTEDLQTTVDRYMADPSPANREAVVVAAVPLVRSLLGKLTLPNHTLATYEDLENTGLLGLLQALDTYDPDRGTQFVTHAYWRVRGSLIDYLRSIDALSRGKRKKLAEANKAIDTLRQMLGEEPSDQDVADYLDVSLDEYYSLMSEAQCRFALSLHTTMGDEDSQTMLDVLPHEDGEAGFAAVDHDSVMGELEKLIAELPERQRIIMGLYYTEDLTLREIGAFFDLTEARISQILGKTLLTLRSKLEAVQATA